MRRANRMYYSIIRACCKYGDHSGVQLCVQLCASGSRRSRLNPKRFLNVHISERVGLLVLLMLSDSSM